MRPSRVVALVVSVLVGIPFALSGPAASAAPTPTTLTVRETPKRAIFHDEVGPVTADVVRHTGALTDGDVPVVGATVTLQRLLVGQTTWTDLADTTTNDEGWYSFRSYVAGNASYKVVYDGDGLDHSPSESGEVTLEAMRDFNAVLVEKERTAVLKGNVNPGWDGKPVHWERKTCRSCSWRVVDRAATGDHGGWKFSGGYPPIGKTWYYRATLRSTDEFVRSVSAMLITDRVQGRQAAGRVAVR